MTLWISTTVEGVTRIRDLCLFLDKPFFVDGSSVGISKYDFIQFDIYTVLLLSVAQEENADYSQNKYSGIHFHYFKEV